MFMSRCTASISTRRGRQHGVALIEVLVAVLLLLIGILGMAGVQVRASQSEFESYQRKQALILLQDMVDRLQANRLKADCYALTNATSGAPFAGTSATLPTCGTGTSPGELVALADMSAWSDALLGAAAAQGGSNVGAIIGARGCIADKTGGVYTVSVAWQGMSATSAPPAALTCGKNQYGDEALRRMVSMNVRVVALN